MCRVLMYHGEAVRLGDLLYQPNNSLVRQAFEPQMLEILNLAGFGMLAWDEVSHHPETPYSYHSVNIPVFDQNLKSLAGKLRASTVIAHVRGVEADLNPAIGAQNLHPFRYPGYTLAMAHNGNLAGFDLMRFALLEFIKPEIAVLIQGNTDTEWIYALLLSRLPNSKAAQDPEEILQALEQTLSILRDVRRRHGLQTSSPVNLFITDGDCLIALRFTFDFGCYDMTNPEKIRTSRHKYLDIWYTTGKSYGLHDGEWKMIAGLPRAGGMQGNSVLISSEPLTRDTSTWFEVPEYSALIVASENGKQTIRVQFLDV